MKIQSFILALFISSMLLFTQGIFNSSEVDASCDAIITLSFNRSITNPGLSNTLTVTLSAPSCSPGRVDMELDFTNLDWWSMVSTAGWTQSGNTYTNWGFPGPGNTLSWNFVMFTNGSYTCPKNDIIVTGTEYHTNTSDPAIMILYAGSGITLTNNSGASHSYDFQVRSNSGSVIWSGPAIGSGVIGNGGTSGPDAVQTLACNQNPHSAYYSADGGSWTYCDTVSPQNGCSNEQFRCTDTGVVPTNTPTPTPTPPSGTATPTPGICPGDCGPGGAGSQSGTSCPDGGVWYWDNQPSGSRCPSGPDSYCFLCSDPDPTSGPTPTDIPGCDPACGPTENCVKTLVAQPPPPPGPCTGQCQQESTGSGCLESGGWSRISGTCTSPAVCCKIYVPVYSYTCEPNPPTSTPTSPPDPPTLTPTPTPTTVPTFTISGTVFIDTNENGIQDGGESGYSGTSIFAASGGDSGSDATNASGDYSILSLLAGSYTVTLSTPVGYVDTTTNPSSAILGPSRIVNFGIALVPPPDCSGGLFADVTTVDAGGSVNLTVSGCTDVEDPDDGNPPPPFDWDPPQDDNPSDEGDPECNDSLDNDGDGLIDTNDPGCHWDGDSDNPGSYDPEDDNEGPNDTPTQCNDSLDNDGDGAVDTADPECHTDYNPDNPGSYDPGDDNESDRVSDGESGSTTCSDGGLIMTSSTSTSSTAIWTAPMCPVAEQVCTITSIVNGIGGSDLNTIDITVNQSGRINVDVRDVTDGSACDGLADLYIGDVTIGLSGPDFSTTETISDGTYSFVCLPDDDYTVSLGLPPGYQEATGTTSQPATINSGAKTVDIRFCIANWEPWYQTESGDIRMRGIVNPIPAGLVGSIGENSNSPQDSEYPSVYFSTQYNVVSDAGGSLSGKGWAVNSEYNYNSLTKNRNGNVNYSFYKSRARQEGVAITEIGNGDTTLDASNSPTTTGIYEINGDLTINEYVHVAGNRVTLLVNGNVTINSEISIPVGNLFILAASGDITVADTIGHSQADGFGLLTSNLEGYYSAEGNIVLEGDGCSAGVPDRRLNVAGAVIANAKKPFATDGAGSIQNNRSLCVDDNSYPTLYVSSRPDFLTQLTDFYKVSYTKWREIGQ